MRTYIIGLMAVLGMSMAHSQTFENPLPVNEGENVWSCDASTTVYYKYSAPADQLVRIEGKAVNMVYEGDNTIPVYCTYSPNTTTFAVMEGADYSFSLNSGGATSVTFTASMEARPYTDGKSCAGPVELNDGDNFIPFCKEGAGMFAPTALIYMSYTPAIDGRMEIVFTSMVSALEYSMSCDGEFSSLAGEYVAGGWKASLAVSAGTEYLIRGKASSAMMAVVRTVSVLPGLSCEDAFTAKRGSNNVIPAAAGTYYYKVAAPSAPENMFMTVTSDAVPGGGYAKVLMACGSENGAHRVDGVVALRVAVAAKEERIIVIDKPVPTADDECFTIGFQDYQAYDRFGTAEELETGVEMATPDFGGVYYYSVTSPASGSCFLNVKARTEVGEGTSVSLYDQEQEYLTLARGNASLRYEVKPGTVYVVKWECSNADRGMPFEVSFSEVGQGESPSNPLEAVVGDNGVPLDGTSYYRFMCEENAWVVMSVPYGVDIPKVSSMDESGNSAVVVYPLDNGAYRFEGMAGKSYLLSLGGMQQHSSFTLAYEDYAQGEVSSNPLDVAEAARLPETVAKVWYRYEVASDGRLVVSTDMLAESGSYVYVYVNSLDEGNRKSMSPVSLWSNEYAPLQLDVAKGDAVYACVNMASPQSGRSITFALRDLQAGESPLKPIEISFDGTFGAYDFVRGENSSQWYSVELPEGIFSLSSSTYMTMSLYYGGDAETPLARSVSFSEASGYYYGFKSYAVNAAGRYLIELTYPEEKFSATLAMRVPEEGEAASTAVRIEVTGETMTYEFPEVAYDDTPMWYSIDLLAGEFNMFNNGYTVGGFYSGTDFFKPMADVKYSADNGYAISGLRIPAPGLYYFCLSRADGGIATLKGSALETGGSIDSADVGDDSVSVSVSAGCIRIRANGVVVSVCDMNGRVVQAGTVNKETQIAVSPGIYIVKVGGKVEKIVVM